MGAFLYKQAIVFFVLFLLLTMYLFINHTIPLEYAQILMIYLSPLEIIAFIIGLVLHKQKQAAAPVVTVATKSIFTPRNVTFSVIGLVLGFAPLGILWIMYSVVNTARGSEAGDWGFLFTIPFIDALLMWLAVIIAGASIAIIAIYFAVRALRS